MTEKEWTRTDAAIGKENRKRLNKSRVTMVGLGGLGAEITRQLAMCGVGEFVLVDMDAIDETNVKRHPAEIKHIGREKVRFCTEMILGNNQNAKIYPFIADARFQPQVSKNSDLLIISGLGSNTAQEIVANKARRQGVPVLVAGVLDEGIGGEIFYINQEKGPCYTCYTTASDQRADKPIGDRAYGIPADQVSAMPGLSSEINTIASLAAIQARRMLLDESFSPYVDSRVNLLLFAIKELKIPFRMPDGTRDHIGPYESIWLMLPKDKHCINCLNRNNSKVRLNDILD